MEQMRVVIIGLTIGFCLMLGLGGGWLSQSETQAQTPTNLRQQAVRQTTQLHQNGMVSGQAGSQMAIASDHGVAQHITLIDSETGVITVYHVDNATGRISLKGVRNIRWDSQMEEFNGETPSPREIRSLVERR